MSGASSGAVIHWHHRTAVIAELLLSCTLVHDVVSVPMATVSKWVLYHQSMPTSWAHQIHVALRELMSRGINKPCTLMHHSIWRFRSQLL